MAKTLPQDTETPLVVAVVQAVAVHQVQAARVLHPQFLAQALHTQAAVVEVEGAQAAQEAAALAVIQLMLVQQTLEAVEAVAVLLLLRGQ